MTLSVGRLTGWSSRWLGVELNFQYCIYTAHTGRVRWGQGENPKYHYRCKFEPEAEVEIMEGVGAWRSNLCGRGEGDGDNRGRWDNLAAKCSRRASSNAR